MSKYPTKTEKMQFTAVLIDQILNNREMQEALSKFGIGLERLQKLKKLHAETTALFEVQINEFGDQLEATKNYKQIWQEANKHYVTTLKIARMVFRNFLNVTQSLQLNGERKTNLLDWYDQAKSFYNGILHDETLLVSMQDYNFSEEVLSSELEMVEKVYAAYLVQKKEAASAVQATENRDKMFDELYQQVMDLKTVVKIAFNGRVEWLKSVGM